MGGPMTGSLENKGHQVDSGVRKNKETDSFMQEWLYCILANFFFF